MFEYNLESNLLRIIKVLKDKTYAPGAYYDFRIYDPKRRIISVAPYFDGVMHHALINVVEPIIGKSFIYDTYACIKGKGTHKVALRYRDFQKKNIYVLKCDIKKYFESIDTKPCLAKSKRRLSAMIPCGFSVK